MDGIGWALSAMSAARTRLDVAAQNLANSSTDGFRKTNLRGFLDASGVQFQRSPDTAQGALRRTGRDFDFAIVGAGAFRLRDHDGRLHQTRSGSFARDRFSRLVDREGRVLIGAHGPVCVPEGAIVDGQGSIVRDGIVLNRIPLPSGSNVRSGFLESSNVDVISQMIDVLTSQRSFEAAQKVLAVIDRIHEHSSTQLAELKS